MKQIIAVIIPTHNRKACLRTLLECLRLQKEGEYSLLPVVVADGCTDGTLEMIRAEFPETKIIEGDGNWWYTRCINEGIRFAEHTDASFVLTVNDDIRFNEDYIHQLLSVYEKEGPDCLVGSVSYTMNKPYRITFSGISKIIRWRLKEVNYIPKFSVADPYTLTGYKPSMNLSGRGILIPMPVFKKTGYYDGLLVQYASDTDFSYRACKNGIKVLVSYDARVFENEQLTSKDALYNKPGFFVFIGSFFSNYSANSLQKTMRFYRKHGYPLLLPFYFCFVIFSSVWVFFNKYRSLPAA